MADGRRWRSSPLRDAVSRLLVECNYTIPLTNQVNLPKMLSGGLDVSFFIVYVGQGALTPEGYDNAYKQAVEKFDAIHRLTEVIAPDKIGLALTAADVRKIAASGRKVAVIGIENGSFDPYRSAVRPA